MKVKKWISYKEAEKYKEVIGGMGGWFNAGHIFAGYQKGQRWKDYITIYNKKGVPYAEAIRQSILENNYRLMGNEHQESPNGVPFFEDNTVALFSLRGWGDLMAAIWSEKENKDYHYMDFYHRTTKETL